MRGTHLRNENKNYYISCIYRCAIRNKIKKGEKIILKTLKLENSNLIFFLKNLH